MNPTKQARLLREWFAREKKNSCATRIVANNASVMVDHESMVNKKRPEMFSLIIEHDNGTIIVPFNSEIMGKWKKEISEFSYMFWMQGQHSPYAKYGNNN